MTIQKLREIALSVLPRMFLPEQAVFAHCIRKGASGIAAEGVSQRYTAMTLIGLATESPADARGALAGMDPMALVAALLGRTPNWTNLGDTAVTLWAARLWGHGDAERALRRIQELDPVHAPHPTVEIAWTVAALTCGADKSPDADLAHAVARRLMACYNPATRLFPHQPVGAPAPFWRAHVGCFADQVYPIQSLAYFGMKFSDQPAIEASRGCGKKICEVMGRDGQWWWHYDVRTGRVVEGYPVYAVHQDAMAPMCLFAAQEASGENFDAAVELGLRWLVRSPEIGGASLIDTDNGIIWRKVCRREPNKLTRAMQSAASWVHSSLRAPGVNGLFPPTEIDWESRPYHMGWLLHAFPASRADRFLPQSSGSNHDSARSHLAQPTPV